MELFYEVRHPDRGYGDVWGREEYMGLVNNLLGYANYMSIGIYDNRLEIEIPDKGLKGKKMPRDMRKYLLSKGLEIIKVKRVRNLTANQIFKIERKARERGKTIIPIGTDPVDGSCEIQYRDAPQ
jgi:hypothetical protein